MDANFRTYPTVLRTIVVVTPAVVSIAVFCALEIVHHPKNLHIFVGGNAVSIANVLSFTSTTLAIFLIKKVVLKIRGAHATFPGSDIIACVVLRAKMELRPARSTRRLHKYVDVSSIASATPQIQPMVLSRRMLSKIDALNCFLPQCFSTKHDAPVTAWLLALWYLVGVIGLLLLSVPFVSLMVNAEALHTPLLQPLPSNAASWIALSCTVAFCGGAMLHLQADLLHALCSNFDNVFASIQAVTMMVCLADTTRRDLARCLVLLAWTIWFQLALTVDAFTPLMKEKLHLRKRFFAPRVCRAPRHLRMGPVDQLTAQHRGVRAQPWTLECMSRLVAPSE